MRPGAPLRPTKRDCKVLEKVRAGYQGYQSGVRTLMLESPHAALFRGVLGDLVEVEAEYARAVEVALGESLQALISDSDSGLLKGIAHLRGAFRARRHSPR